MAESISVRLRSSEARRASCSYCHEPLSDPIRLCMSCHTSLHEDCFQELGRCPTLGCVASGVWNAEEQQPAPEASPIIETPQAPAEPASSLSNFERFTIYAKLLFSIPLTLVAWIWTTLWVFISFIGLAASLGTFHDPMDWVFMAMVLILNLLFVSISRQLTRWTRSLLSDLDR